MSNMMIPERMEKSRGYQLMEIAKLIIAIRHEIEKKASPFAP
ncbi:unnamed protein product [Arabidopsis halleri]